MQKVIRKEVTIEIEDDYEEALKEKARYEKLGYICFEFSEEWIQLDKMVDN